MKINSNESLKNFKSRSPLNSLLSTSTNNNDSHIINNINHHHSTNYNRHSNLAMKSLSSSYSFSSSSTDSSSSSARLRRSMMLQTAYLGCQYETLRQDENVQKFRKRIDDEQSDTCMKWINLQFSRLLYDSNGVISNEAKETYAWLMVTDLCKDLSDGLRLVYLVEILYNTKLKKELGSKTFGCLKLHKIKNHETCLNYLQREVKLKCVGINPLDLVEGNKKMIVSLLFLIKNDFERRLFNKPSRPDRKSCFIISSSPHTSRSKSQTLIGDRSERKKKYFSSQYPSVSHLIDELNARAKSSDTCQYSRASLVHETNAKKNKSATNSSILLSTTSSSKLDHLNNLNIKQNEKIISDNKSNDLKYSEVSEIRNEVLVDLIPEVALLNEKGDLFYSEILELHHDYVTELDQDLTDSGYSNNTIINCDESATKRSKSNSLESIDSKNQTDLTVNDIDEYYNNNNNSEKCEHIINSNVKIVNNPEYSVLPSEENADNLDVDLVVSEHAHVEIVEDSLELERATALDGIEVKLADNREVFLVDELVVEAELRVDTENLLGEKIEINLDYQVDDCRDSDQFDYEIYDNEDDDDDEEEENTDTVIHNSSFMEPDEYEDDEYKFENIDLEEKIRDLDELLENHITKDEQLLEILNENLINEKDNLKDIEQILSKQQQDDSSLNQASYFIDNLILDYDHIEHPGFSNCLLDVIEHNEKVNTLSLELNPLSELDENSCQDDLIINELDNKNDNYLANLSSVLESNQELASDDLIVVDSIDELIQPETVQDKTLENLSSAEEKEEEIECKNDDLIIVNEEEIKTSLKELKESSDKEASLINIGSNSSNSNDDDGIQLEDEDQLETDQLVSNRSRSESDSSSNSCRSTLSSCSSHNTNNNSANVSDLLVIDKLMSSAQPDELISKNSYAYALVNGSAAQIKIIDKQHCSTNGSNSNNKRISNESPRVNTKMNRKTQRNRVKLNVAPVEVNTNRNSFSDGNQKNEENEEKQDEKKEQQPISCLKPIELIDEKKITNNDDQLVNNNKPNNKLFKPVSNNSTQGEENQDEISKTKSKKVHINSNSLVDKSKSTKKSSTSNTSNKKSTSSNKKTNFNSSSSLLCSNDITNLITKYFLIAGFILLVSLILNIFINNESVFNMYDLFDVMSKLMN